MAFPSSKGSNPFSYDDAFTTLRSHAGSIKQNAQQLVTKSAAGPVFIYELRDFVTETATRRAEMNTLATPELATWAVSQPGGANLANDWTAMRTQIDAVVNAGVSGLPKAPTGELLTETLGAGGVLTQSSWSTAQTAGLRTLLNALIATID